MGASGSHWCLVSGEVSSLEMPPFDLWSHPLRMESASRILLWLAAVLGPLPSFCPSLSPGAGLSFPSPSDPKALSWSWPYPADAGERTSWPLDGELFSSPCRKWAASLPCAARDRVVLAGSWDGPDTAEPHSWGTVQIRKLGLGELWVEAEWSRVGRDWQEIPLLSNLSWSKIQL